MRTGRKRHYPVIQAPARRLTAIRRFDHPYGCTVRIYHDRSWTTYGTGQNRRRARTGRLFRAGVRAFRITVRLRRAGAGGHRGDLSIPRTSRHPARH